VPSSAGTPVSVSVPTLSGPNVFTGTQDFTGATVTGLTGAVSSVVGLAGAVTGTQIAADPALKDAFARGVSVLEHGAVGDDITFDNADAIDAALAEAAATGGYVVFPDGDFRFSRPIVFTAPIMGAGPNLTQLRPLATFSGTFAIDFSDTVQRKFIKHIRISGAGVYGCIDSSNDGKGSSLTLFENVWFTDTNTSNYAVASQSSTSGSGALTGSVFLRCAWDNTPHMVRIGDNQDDVTFIGCRFNMISSNQPSTAPILLRGQNEKQLGCYYGLNSTTSVETIKEFIQVGAHAVSIENGFFEVQGGATGNFTDLVWAAEPACHLTMRDITFRVSGTSTIVYAVYTEAVSTTTANDSVIELHNWRVLGGPLTRALHVLVNAPAASRSFVFSGIDTMSTALVTLATGTPSTAATDYLRLNGEWLGKTYGHTVSHNAALVLSYTDVRLGKLDFPPTSVDPRGARPTDVAVVGTVANTALYYRVRDGGTISKVALEVTTSSGNISVGVYANSGSGRSAAPSALKVSSGALACPAIGVQEIALTAAIRVEPGDWLAISADNATAAFRSTITAEETTALGNGLCYKQATAHPLPSTPASLTAITGRNILLVGTP